MKVAVTVTDGMVEGPGESKEVEIYSLENGSISLVEKYENPALKAEHTRGIFMIKSAMERKCDSLIFAEAGAPAFNFVKGKMKIYSGRGMKSSEAVLKFSKNELPEMTGPTETGHHMHEHHSH